MTEIFLKIMNMSISATWLILAVLVIRLLLKKAPRWISVLLWGIVAVRLVCPFFPESPLSLIPSAEAIHSDIMMDKTPVLYTGISALDIAVNPMITESFAPNPGDSANPLQIWIPVLAVIWCMGMAGLLLYTAFSYFLLRRKVSTAVLLKDDIFQSEHVASPFVLGILRPKIYLPYQIEQDTLVYVVAHEQAHIKRRDHWWKLLGILLLSLHWFNPFLWLAYAMLCQDIEGACDERVIQEFDNKQRADYSQALLHSSVSHRKTPACPLAFGEVGVKERVRSILRYKKPAFWLILVAVALCGVVSICFLSNPKKNRYNVHITIPAGSESSVYYSDEEISPMKSEIRFEMGQGIGDTVISLRPIEVRQENAYDESVYATPGFTSSMHAERGAWFKVGIFAGNPTEQDITVFVAVSPVEVRDDSAVPYAERPMLFMNGRYYVDPYMPVPLLPDGYESKGTLSEKEAYNTELAGAEYFVNPDQPDDFYVYQECGTPIGPNMMDSEKRQWAYVQWIWIDSEE